MSTPLSAGHFICTQEGGPCWSCFSCHCEWPVKQLAQRSRFSDFLFPLCAKITAACWMSWQVRVILLLGHEACRHEGWDPLSWHNTHTDVLYRPDAVLLLMCVGWNGVCESLTQITLLSFWEPGLINYSWKNFFFCSDFEFSEFCLMFHFTLLPLDGFAFDEAPDSLTIGSHHWWVVIMQLSLHFKFRATQAWIFHWPWIYYSIVKMLKAVQMEPSLLRQCLSSFDCHQLLASSIFYMSPSCKVTQALLHCKDAQWGYF